MLKVRKGFLVGLRTRKSRALLVIGRRPSPVRGPFTLTAVVSGN